MDCAAHPYNGDDAHGPGEAGRGLQEEGVVDGHVALRSERHDGKHRSVRGSFGHQRSQAAQGLAQAPGILLPVQLEVIRKTCGITERERQNVITSCAVPALLVLCLPVKRAVPLLLHRTKYSLKIDTV